MRTLFVTDPPPVVEEWLERRRALGQDRYDEVWEGDYHVAPAPGRRHADVQAQLMEMLGPRARQVGMRALGPTNIGGPGDYRVPDLALVRGGDEAVWSPTAAIVVEVVSPGDETYRKLGFYRQAGVEEVLIVDPDGRTVEWFVRGTEAFSPADGSDLLGITAADLAAAIDWPA